MTRFTCLISFSLCVIILSFQSYSAGYCGDGIINGNEECDGPAMPFYSCHIMGGNDGILGCQHNCVIDISQCSTSASIDMWADMCLAEVAERIGGIAEICSCDWPEEQQECYKNCNHGNNTTICNYSCEQRATCQCEGKLEANVENCNFSCTCKNQSNVPDCDCSMKKCETITAISPNIGSHMGLGNL
jgi:hypothetical protein